MSIVTLASKSKRSATRGRSRPTVAQLEAQVAALRSALFDVATATGSATNDGRPCWCTPVVLPRRRGGAHETYCLNARTAFDGAGT